MHKIEIYSTPTCHYCKDAKAFFDNQQVSYVEHNVGEDLVKRKEMIDISGQMGVPVIAIDNHVLIGFSEQRVAELLEEQQR